MGQKVNATGYRLGHSSEYESIWFETDLNTYSGFIRNTTRITEYIYSILKKHSIICTRIKKVYYNNTIYLFIYYFNTKKSKVPLSFNQRHEPNVDYYIHYLMQRIYNKYKINVTFLFKEINQDNLSSTYISELLKFEYENKKSVNLKDAMKSIILNVSSLDNKNSNIYYIKNTEHQFENIGTQLITLLEQCHIKAIANSKEIIKYKHQLINIYEILDLIKPIATTNDNDQNSLFSDKYTVIKETYKNNNNIIGMRIEISGRLNGAEMAKTEKYIIGSIPFQELKTKIEYSCTAAITMYGLIGIKTWIAWAS
jgi:hypothetical protein